MVLGTILSLFVIIFFIWYVLKDLKHKGLMLTFCALILFFSAFLIMSDRVIEFTIKGIGTIKAAARQAQAKVQEIQRIEDRIQAQSATVDLVAEDAFEAKKLSEEANRLSVEAKKLTENLNQKSDIALHKLQDINDEVKKASDISKNLQAIAEFNDTVVSAQSNDRKAFDKLYTLAQDQVSPFSKRAAEAYTTILDDHSKGIWEAGFKIPWKEGLNPATLTFEDLKEDFYNEPEYLQPAFLEYIWGRGDISKKQKMEFFIDVIKNSDNLRVIEYAGRYFTEGANLKIKPLAIEYLLSWWNTNKDQIQ